MGVISIISIDIGLKNLAIYKEYFDTDTAKNIVIPKLRYNKLGEAHPEFKEYIDKVAQCGQCVFIDKHELGQRKDMFNNKVFLEIIDYFDKLNTQGIFNDVNVILIEKQLKINGIASIIMHHIHSWMMINFRDFKKTILYPPKNKTRILGAALKELDEKGKATRVDKSFRKKWAVKRAEEILILREDLETLSIFEKNKSKRDDIADTLIQCLSYNVQKLIK